jgi:mono/diheme cytochrome c family protein
MKKLFLVTLIAMLSTQPLYAADGTVKPEEQIDDRWYTESYLRLGKTVFESNCMVCHGANGQGLAEDWKKPLADGTYPPPPLNGTAHTWHHPASMLLRTINKGGKDMGGQMPAFAQKLSENEKVAVVAYVQNWWSDEIYGTWLQRGGLSK